ncbi:MAG: Hsp20/alpha crystallin family protein [Thermoplasmata archaeon]
MAKNKKEDEQEKKIKELEEQLNELKTQKGPSVVEGVLGGMIPGLGGLVKTLTNASPEFKKRIEETDAEIKKRLAEGGSRRPVVSFGYSTRTLVPSKEGEWEITNVKKPEKPKTETITPKEEAREPLVDIFDEKESITVIAEMPGVNEKEIETTLEKNTLKISGGKYSKELKLPSTPEKIVEKTYKNGILEVKMKKR